MGKMQQLIEEIEAAGLDEQAASALLRVALGLMVGGKGAGRGTAKARLEAATAAWQGVADAARAVARLTERGELAADGRTRRFIAFLVHELEGALAATGAAEAAISGGPSTAPPPPMGA
jgi:hypothetical protein